MKPIIAWFVHNPIAANLLMVLIAFGGISTFPTIEKQFFPERELNTVTVTVVYPGAGPAEVEQQICQRIEEAVNDLDGIEELRSTAQEGMGQVTIEVESNYDTLRLLNEVKGRIDAITSFPVESEKPLVSEQLYRSWVISVALAGDIGEANLKELGEQIRDDLAALPAVQLVELRGPRDYELSIEISEINLRRYGLRFEDVVNAIRGSSLNLPAGKLRTRDGDIQVQSRGQAYTAQDFAEIVLVSKNDGTQILLGDVAEIIDGFEDIDSLGKFNDKPSLSLSVFNTTRPDIIKTSDQVRAYVDEIRPLLPPGVEIEAWRDMSISFKGRMNTLIFNGLGGLLLVYVILLLFLRPLLALWVSVGIAVAFLGSMWLLPATGATLNMVSLFAFILILGIVVDDAIIVGESIYTHQKMGDQGPHCAIAGATAVTKPVMFAVITTMLFFAGFFLLPDDSPEPQQIPKVVLLALTFSLIECLLLLPAHLAHMGPEQPGKYAILARLELLRERFARGMEHFASNIYQPALAKCMQARNLTLMAFTMSFLVFFSVYAGGWMKFQFFPRVPADFLVTTVNLHEGSPFNEAERIMRHVEDAALALKEEVNVEGEVPVIGSIEAIVSPDVVRVSISMANVDERGIPAEVLRNRWQEKIGELAGVKDVEVTFTLFTMGKPIEFRISARDLDELRAASTDLREELASYSGVFNIRDSLENPRPEIELSLKPLAETMGITLADLARQVRRGFYGEEVQRIPRTREDVKVMVRYPYAERNAEDFLREMRIRTPDGREVPFEAVAEITYVPSYRKIERINRERVATVSAEASGVSPRAVIAQIAAEKSAAWKTDFPGVSFEIHGEEHDQQDFYAAMNRLMIGVSIVVFGLMAVVFKSYWQPLLILSAIPFGFMGAIIGHLLFGREVSMFSVMGVLACAGVVINDNLVLIDRVNQLRDKGLSLYDALLTGGKERFRPIILTSVTTFVGLTPIMMEQSVQAQFLIPMVLSLAFGVLLATGVTLIFVPCLYLLLDRAAQRGANAKVKVKRFLSELAEA